MCDPEEKRAGRVNAALSVCRQGDFVLSDKPFLHLADIREPLTITSKKLASESDRDDLGLYPIATEVAGLALVTQTCDIVRCCLDRPYVDVVPLVAIPQEELEEVRRGRLLSYAYIPGAQSFSLAADLERVMTVEKSVVAGWEIHKGCQADEDVRRFAEAIKRKFGRFAFPEDFVTSIRRFRERIRQKHKKNTDEGKLLRALREIRVRASPSWNSERVDLFFWFIIDEDADLSYRTQHYNLCEKWIELLRSNCRFRSVDFILCGLEDLTAKDYVESDPLNFEDLS